LGGPTSINTDFASAIIIWARLGRGAWSVRASVVAHVKSFSPLAAALPDRALPERLYLESKWASLVSYGVTARLLEDVLPLDGHVNANGIRRHTHRVARRCEGDLLAEQDTEPRAEEWPTDNIPPPKPAITVGLDGGYIRSRDAPNRNEGWFEVIAGKSTVHQGGSSCFAFVHRLDRHARARIGSVLKSHGLVYRQPVTFVTDGGDTVRSWPKRLHPRAEHVIDWFHIAMRFTVLKQMAKGMSIPNANPDDPADHPERLLESAKWGKVCKASQPAASVMSWTLQRWILSLGVIIQKWQYSVAQ
jgi:hypothetical protein